MKQTHAHSLSQHSTALMYPMRVWRARLGTALSSLLLALAVWVSMFVSAPDVQAQVCPPPLKAPTAEQIQQAQRSIRNRGYLWKITKDNRSSYLYGTIHIGRLEWMFPGPNLTAAWSNVDVLALEVDPLDEKMQAELMTAPAEKTSESLPQKLRQRLDRQMTAACAPSQAVTRLSPIMQALVISMLRGRFHGLESAYGQEIALSSMARQTGKPVLSLETADIQRRALVPGNPQESLPILDSLLTQLESGKTDKYYLRLSEIWNSSNLADLENVESWCECAEKDIDKRLLKRMNDDRNSGMAERIQALHEQGKRVLAAVGALHMTGNQALPKLMQERGFTVVRVH